MNSINDKILNSIKILTDSYLKGLSFDQTVRGKVEGVLGNNKYNIKIKKTNYTIGSSTDMVYAINDIVYVCRPEGKENDQFIIGKVR